MLTVAVTGCIDLAPDRTTGTMSDSFVEDADPAVTELPFVEKELLVLPYPGADAAGLAAAFDQAGAAVIDELPEIDLAVLEVADGDLARAAGALAASGLIETVQKNYVFTAQLIPDDPLFGGQPHLDQISAPQAWNLSVGDESIPIAVVDTGVDATHHDLAAKVVGGWNVLDDTPDSSDVAGHGTQVAGIAAAASNNATGVTGVAWKSPILAVRVTNDSGRATSRHIAAGIVWAAAHGARVINVSFAPLWSNRVVRAAAQTAFNRGSLVIISAGNGAGLTASAGYREALFVGAIDSLNDAASFTDRGPFVDLAAPGVGIRTTQQPEDYGFATGTSFAAPIVSGVAALAWSVNREAPPAAITRILVDTTTDLGPSGKDSTFGAGAVNAAAAVAAATQLTAHDDVTPPTLAISRPLDGALLVHRTAAIVSASDDVAVLGVTLFVDGIAVATDTRAPYYFVVDPARFSPGRHELGFEAADASGNRSARQTVTMTFDPATGTSTAATTITFRAPADGTVQSGDVDIHASIRDDDGLAVVEWFVDSASVWVASVSGTGSGLSFIWRSDEFDAGEHLITLVVTDARGVQTAASLRLTTR